MPKPVETFDPADDDVFDPEAARQEDLRESGLDFSQDSEYDGC